MSSLILFQICLLLTLTIFGKSSIIDVWLGSKYASDFTRNFRTSTSNTEEILNRPTTTFYKCGDIKEIAAEL